MRDGTGEDAAGSSAPSESSGGSEPAGSSGDSGSDGNQPLRDLARGAGIVYVGLLVEVLIAFLAQVIAARYLSTSGFGGITTGTTVVNLGAILAALGLEQGLTRYLPRLDEDEKRVVVRYTYFLTVPLSLVVGLAISLGADPIATDVFGDPSVAVSLRVFGAAIPFATVLGVSAGGIRGQKRSTFRVYVENITLPIVRFTLVIFAVAYGFDRLGIGPGGDQYGIAIAYALPYVAGAILATVLFVRTLPESPSSARDRSADRALFLDVLRYSGPLVLRRASGFVYRSLDVFLILYFLDSGAVGAYGVAYMLAQLMLMFSTAFNYLGSPVASELEADGDPADLVDFQRSMLRWLVGASTLALVPMVLFADDLITIIYRSDYAVASAAFAVLTVGFAAHNVLGAQNNLLEAVGASRALALNSVAASVANVVLNLLLIPEYGITGAAVATVVAYLLMDGLALVELKRYLGSFVVSWRVVAPAVVAVPVSLVAWLLKPMVPQSLLAIAVFGVVYAAVYLVSVVVVLGLTPEEVMLLRSAEERWDLDIDLLDAVIERFS